MVTKSPNAPGPLTREESEKWWQAYLAAQLKFLNPRKPSGIPGAGHLCSDFAWVAVEAYRKAVRGERS